MDFNLFKKPIRQTNIIVGIVSLFLVLIELILIYAIKGLDLKTVRIPFTILIILNYLFIFLTVFLLNRFKGYVSFTYLFVTYKYEINNQKTVKSKFQVNHWIHLFVFLLVIFLYFIELTATIPSHNNNWLETAKNNWWAILIISLTNLIILEFSLYFNRYLFNHDQILIKRMK